MGVLAGVADSGRSLAELRTYISFLRYDTPEGLVGQRGKGRTVCVCGYFKGLWDFNGDVLPLL